MIVAPLPANEQDRLLALESFKIFGTAPAASFDRLTTLACRIFDVPMAFVTLIGTDTQWLKSSCGLAGVNETPRSIAFCSHAILSDDVLVVQDAANNPRFWDNPLVTGPPYIRFYAGCPLRTADGHNLGGVCLVDTKPREATPEMLASLRDLSAFVMSQMDLHKHLIDEEARQRRDAETNYQRLADSINGMVFRIKPISASEHRCLYVSPGSLDLLDCPPETFYEDTAAFVGFVHPADRDSFCEAYGISRRDSQPWSWSGRILTRGGQEKWVRGEGRWERCSQGEAILEGLVIDISEMKHREEALSEAKELAEEASQAKSEFLSRMSHELRTPMNAILGFTQILQMESVNEEAKEDLAQIQKAGDHLLGLINQVLDLTAVDARKLSAIFESVGLAELLGETVGLLRPLLECYGVRTPTIAGATGLTVLADRHRLKQVMINLVTNAIKYNRAGGCVRIDVGAIGDEISIEVSDQGHGIAPERMGKLFQPFERLGAEETEIEGTGLGLSISHGLVEIMRGTLNARSVVGEGTTFTLRLPAAVDAAAPEPPVHEVPEASVDLNRCEILYVEDNASNILLVQRILGRRPNVCLVTVGSIAAGLERLAVGAPHLLLLDMNLPDGSGEEIIRWVRTASPFSSLPIIVLSADAMPHQAEQMLLLGADHYLTKPLQIPSFLSTLDSMIGEGRA